MSKWRNVVNDPPEVKVMYSEAVLLWTNLCVEREDAHIGWMDINGDWIVSPKLEINEYLIHWRYMPKKPKCSGV